MDLSTQWQVPRRSGFCCDDPYGIPDAAGPIARSRHDRHHRRDAECLDKGTATPRSGRRHNAMIIGRELRYAPTTALDSKEKPRQIGAILTGQMVCTSKRIRLFSAAPSLMD